MHSFFRAQDNIYGTELDDYVRSIQVNCLCRLFLFSAFATSALSLSLRASLGGTVERAQLLVPYDRVRSSQSTGPRAGRVPTTAKMKLQNRVGGKGQT